MRKFLLVPLLVWTALPVFAAQRVTVEQLEQVLAASHGKPDAKVAEELSGLELTEQLSTARLARWEADAPGPASRQSLVVLADVSAFLDPPAAEIPATPAPSVAVQQHIIDLAAVFAKNTISKLPNFFATRETARFVNTPGDFRNSSAVDYQPLHLVDSSRDTVLYRDGQEVVNLTAAERKKYGLSTPGLSTSGVFGPMLAAVLMDTAQGTLAWGHWEQGPAGPEAVFRYEIPGEKSHYEVELSNVFQDHPAYHGEFAVDPANGAILRLKIEADMKPDDPVARSGILVEYGPVVIGGKTYICPVKSVAIQIALGQAVVASSGGRGARSARSSVMYSDMEEARKHLRTSLNDVVFEQYHLFRAEARVLTGDNAEPAGNPPASSPAETKGTGPVAAAEQPVETVAAEESAPAAAAESPAPAAPATASAPEPSSAPLPVASPRLAAGSSAGTLPAPTLRVTSRIVYVDVIVRDHQGHIVRGLTEDDFRVSEDGASQKIDFFRAFTHEDSAAMDHSTPSASARGLDLLNPSAASAASAPPDTVNMILFDLLDTSPTSQTYARSQMLKFLAELPPGHKIALFILTDKLRMIQNVTGNSELLVEAARLLLPRAARLFQSDSQQMRSADVLGMLPGVMTGSGMPGGDPESFAMHLAEEMAHENAQNDQMRNDTVNDAFRELAQATAAFNGRKNLFWLSESFPLGVLKTLQSFQFSAGSPVAMTDLSGDRALSGARIAVYPISVLGLETGGVTAAMNGTTAAGGHGAAISGGAVAPNLAADPETTNGVLASQPGASGGERMPDTLSQQAGAREALRDQMEAIAAQTGGEAFVGTNDVAGALRRSLEGGENYYSLVYTPTNKKWNGKFRKIEVKLAHKGYTLSYRQGYVALPEPTAAQVNTQK